jgi:hypothetical protein
MINLEFAQGEVITSGEVGILSKFLQTRKLERIDTPSDRICFKLEKNKPVIRIANGAVHEFPVRRSMVDKLLKWHHINSWTLNKASSETTISFLNDLLLSIKSMNVRIYLEDGDAKTITSSRYTEFMDDDVLNACDNLLISKVSRTDKVLRIDSHITARFQPVVGDECGFGFTIFNSETGFHSLQVSHYILRYVCSNGLILRVPAEDGKSNGMIHYKFNPESLKGFLEVQIKNIKKTQGLIAKKLIQTAETAVTPQARMNAMRLLKRIRGNAEAIKDEVNRAATEWELVNVITAHAREQPVDVRLMMEQSAGRLLY